MILYIVYANAFNDHYNDTVEYLEVEEKNSYYEGCRKRFKKKEIGLVLDGDLMYGSYRMFVLNKEDINTAREMLNNSVVKYRQKQLEKFELELETSLNFNISNEYTMREF